MHTGSDSGICQGSVTITVTQVDGSEGRQKEYFSFLEESLVE